MKNLENSHARIILKPERNRSLKNRHPWVFSGAVEKKIGNPAPGDIVPLFSAENQFLGKGFYNPHSQIQVRMLTFNEEPVDRDFFVRRIKTAIAERREILSDRTNACRLINSDGDLLSGLVVDRYVRTLVLQIHSLGMERIKGLLVEVLMEILQPEAVVERSDSASRNEEGLKAYQGILSGTVPENVSIVENGIHFRVDVLKGQKTGFFLDQRDNRKRIGKLAAGKKVLNCFSYSGGFSIYAALNGATTTSVESSGSARELAVENFRMNGLDSGQHRLVTADVFEYLRQETAEYDIIILDPPAFVKKKSQLSGAARGYKDINRLAMARLKSTGLLMSCSCSHHLNWDMFQKILFGAALDTGRQVQIIGRFGQPPDHPANIYHPEGEYLKTFLLRVI